MNGAILEYVDGVVITSRNNDNQIDGIINEVREKTHLKYFRDI